MKLAVHKDGNLQQETAEFAAQIFDMTLHQKEFDSLSRNLQEFGKPFKDAFLSAKKAGYTDAQIHRLIFLREKDGSFSYAAYQERADLIKSTAASRAR